MPPKGHWGAYWQWGTHLRCPGKLFCGQVVDFFGPSSHTRRRNCGHDQRFRLLKCPGCPLGLADCSQGSCRPPTAAPAHLVTHKSACGQQQRACRELADRADRAGDVAAASVIEPMPTHGNWRAVKSLGRRFLQASLRSAPEGPSLSGERADVGLAVLRAVRMGMDGRSTRKETRAARGGSVG